jgi:hypothetical protein
MHVAKAVTLASIFKLISRSLELIAFGLAASSLVVAVRKIDTLFTVAIGKFKLKEQL